MQEDQDRLNMIAEREKNHRQWSRHGKCGILLMAMVIVTLLRGSKNFDSIVGI